MPNLLNNLLRNIRQKERPNESIDAVARSMNIDYISGTYLTKIENGDLATSLDESLGRCETHPRGAANHNRFSAFDLHLLLRLVL